MGSLLLHPARKNTNTRKEGQAAMRLSKGFTLLELMISVALVAIIAMLAIPSYQSYIQRAARSSVQADLMSAASVMERRRAQNFTYDGATAGTASTDTFSSVSPADAPAGQHKYNLTLTFVEVSDQVVGFEILAVSNGNFASGKTEALKINHLGQKCISALAVGVTDCTLGTDPSW